MIVIILVTICVFLGAALVAVLIEVSKQINEDSKNNKG